MHTNSRYKMQYSLYSHQSLVSYLVELSSVTTTPYSIEPNPQWQLQCQFHFVIDAILYINIHETYVHGKSYLLHYSISILHTQVHMHTNTHKAKSVAVILMSTPTKLGISAHCVGANVVQENTLQMMVWGPVVTS